MDYFFGQVCENSGKNSSHPQNLSAPYTVAVELTKVTSQDYVININDMWKYSTSDFIDLPLPKDSVGPPTTPGPQAPPI